VDSKLKEEIVDHQKLSSDGNTPTYLQNLYNDLYFIQNIYKSKTKFRILPYRRLESVERHEEYYKLRLSNSFAQKEEYLNTDVVILCAGFENRIPEFIEPIEHLIEFDENRCFRINKDFSIRWKGHDKNKVFAQNFSRYGHGIFEPQTSLMAWRSAVITNSISQKEIYQIRNFVPNFLSYESIR
jgi:lysine N6-hydroxylase